MHVLCCVVLCCVDIIVQGSGNANACACIVPPFTHGKHTLYVRCVHLEKENTYNRCVGVLLLMEKERASQLALSNVAGMSCRVLVKLSVGRNSATARRVCIWIE